MATLMIFETELPQGLKPSSSGGPYGAAEVAPLQGKGSKNLISPGNLIRQRNLIVDWNGWALAPIALVAAVLAVPYFQMHGFLPIGLALQRGFALVCHQRPERSFWIFGAPVAVCARCLGIYLGAAIGLLFRASRRVAIHLLIAAAILNLLDVATEFAGLHGNWMTLRFALGIALGAAGGLLISSAIISAVVDSRVPDC
ncbi:MAG: DUF2085 domain-containing protein [Candidatus Korobacteraceae bacterium]